MPREQTTPATPVRGRAKKCTIDGPVWKIRHADLDVYGLGDQAILKHRCLGLICSVQCPGSIVIKTFDAIRELRDAGVTVAGGFHSPMEMECLDFLMRGQQPVIVVAAKGLVQPRLPEPWQIAINADRLLLVSPFANDVRRTTKANAQVRNECVANLADAILIPHASSGGKAESLARSVLHRGKTLYTFDGEENRELIEWGARPFDLEAVTVSITRFRVPTSQ